MLKNPDHTVFFSAASIREMSIKAAVGRADFNVSPSAIVEVALAAGFGEVPVRSAAALVVATPPHHHRDPFDRMLVAQALLEGCRLVTLDDHILTFASAPLYDWT